MRQSRRLLEMSVAELEEEIRSRLDDNPALEVVSSSAGDEHLPENDFHETSEQLQQADYASEDDMYSFAIRTAFPTLPAAPI